MNSITQIRYILLSFYLYKSPLALYTINSTAHINITLRGLDQINAISPYLKERNSS